MKRSIAIIGCGTVGTALGKLLGKAGYHIAGVSTASLSTAAKAAQIVSAKRYSDSPWEISRGVGVVFVTTPDDAIESTCKAIALRKGFDRKTVVIHCSGAHPSTILVSAKECEASVASVHPLQSFASAKEAERLVPGSYFTVEGDKAAVGIARQLVKDLGGIVLEITPAAKALYHAAAVAASNYLVVVMNLALELNRAAGISPDISFKALLPLIRGTLENIGAKGIPQALTGPIARGDVNTVADHIKAMEENIPQFLDIYKTLGRHAVDLAIEKGTLSEMAAKKLIRLLESR